MTEEERASPLTGEGRRKFKLALLSLRKAEGETLFSRQESDEEAEDQFAALYDRYKLLEPPYSFAKLKKVYEESDVLQTCIDAYKENIDGFGYQLLFLGDDVKEREASEARVQQTRLKSFFDFANGKQSWTTIRKLMREDLEVLGNGAFEVVRSNDGRIQLVYHLPFRNIRMARLEKDPVQTKDLLMRDGRLIEVPVKKFFRRFCQIRESSGKKLRWFKELGDPRPMDALTGEFRSNPKISASELWHFKIPVLGQTYGIPRWLSGVLDVMGRRGAQYVNWDLFENQGIPPTLVMISGGKLTDDSWDDLLLVFQSHRGAENWNKVGVLETELASVGLEEKGSAKIEIKNLTEFRKDDLMFERYLDQTEKAIRKRYRLPPLYIGGTEDFSRATADSSKEVAEEQVFIPLRREFDELVNHNIVSAELDVSLWSYRSQGPQITGAEAIARGVRDFGKAGALTVNHAIDLANKAFGLEMSKFDEPWANFPLEIILGMIRQGTFKGIDELVKVMPVLEQLPPANVSSNGN